MSVFHRIALSLLAALCLSQLASAQTITVGVGFDRWWYPFNSTPGTQSSGSVFGALGEPDFDNRDAQLILGFDVAGVSPPSASHVLSGVTLRVTTAGADTFAYDPTFDPLATYTTDPDPDDGRPVELYGVGTRNGFTGLTVDDGSSDPLLLKENSAFSAVPGSFVGTRSAYAADAAGADVSGNVSAGQEVAPWAIGQASLSPGDTVPRNTEFAFGIDLAIPEVSNYIDAGISSGELFLALTSLHTATRGAPPTFPSFFLDAGGVSLGQTAELDFQYTPIPEPGTLGLLLAVPVLLLALRRVGR